MVGRNSRDAKQKFKLFSLFHKMVHIEPGLELPRDFEGTWEYDVYVLSDICVAYMHPGFGEEGFDPQWPNGARIAVSFVLNYEYAK